MMIENDDRLGKEGEEEGLHRQDRFSDLYLLLLPRLLVSLTVAAAVEAATPSPPAFQKQS